PENANNISKFFPLSLPQHRLSSRLCVPAVVQVGVYRRAKDLAHVLDLAEVEGLAQNALANRPSSGEAGPAFAVPAFENRVVHAEAVLTRVVARGRHAEQLPAVHAQQVLD